MNNKTIAVISMGDMGHAVGRSLIESGHDVITCLAGRSTKTMEMAERAGVRDITSLDNLVDEAEILLSILPPSSALQLAQYTVKAGKQNDRQLIYVDCNAISPATAKEIAAIIESAGAKFIDSGIIGLAPGKDTPRFYVSGEDTSAMQGLDGCGFKVIHCGDTPGQASATKMCYAALTKGTFTLHTALLMAANSLGVYETLIEEFRFSQASALEAMENRVPFIPADSERWIGEMEEIANTFRKAGVTGSFHDGAAAVLEVLAKTPFAHETRESLDHTRTLDQAIGEYVKHIQTD